MGFADGVIVMWSEKSNHGVSNLRMTEYAQNTIIPNVTFYQLEPLLHHGLHVNERRKRNIGIEIARKHLYSHFILADADEFYEAKQVEWEKQRFNKPIAGLVCGLKVYVKYPTLRTSDHTLIPFIHKMTNHIKCAENRYYPFAYDNGGPHIDPTRRLNLSNGVQWSEVVMHHMSYVRKDINLKIENSSANLYKVKDAIKSGLNAAAPGFKFPLYSQPLEECPNQFNLPIWNT